MASVLYIQASPRGERSFSSAAADAFVASYREEHPGDRIVTINLFEKDLPAFDGPALNGKYALLNGKAHTPEEAKAWESVVAVVEEFTSADKYVLSLPMWNFSIPYRLKQYLDILIQPSYTFSFSPKEGYKGLVTGKPIFVAYSRGGAYGSGTGGEAMDFQVKYMEQILGFIGFTDVRPLLIEPTLAGGPEKSRSVREAAVDRAGEMAKTF